ncbi:uncharacterized protein NECHADRAFT_102710 [Fusarium vanettenii 77-13-4]|uniref:DUF1772-domain-containing protein n=1 Tax=Fusarium vanettenii (strain ATCC MYA-4622 / CBS 123669 / FGSC 9596 / NRRL 45880 / 77-13-4) TaxID=660122 RepID=C7Z8T3_FUSV7|nr:uncharacterized protein NECHADRAFT_102710 [Fusarium vanettenii 77-13-4]EEU39442.1 hypothetical protein NECHADRAFT_102710 [Fusarium vanettenii 77-13-4]
MDSTTRVIQAIGLTSSIFLAGANIGASHLTVPLLYQQPISINTAFFKDFYIRGAVTLVPLSIVSASASAFAAYLVPSQRTIWVAAAVTTISQIPWTGLVMMGTNNRLNAIAASKVELEKASKEEVVDLLKRWRWMNIVRGSLALVGGLTAVWAAMSE